MTSRRKTPRKTEFGDFQTPSGLASQICRMLAHRGIAPRTIVEPSCGTGSLLAAALESFPSAEKAFGLDINAAYVECARQSLDRHMHAQLVRGDFFRTDWGPLLAGFPDPVLVIGNPPWVTNAALGSMGSPNLPVKQNKQGLSGIDAITGKSNFDISEWMIRKLLDALQERTGLMAMLCKTAVARKVLEYAWSRDLFVDTCEIHPIDAVKHFRAQVDACLLVCTVGQKGVHQECKVYRSLGDETIDRTIGYRDGLLVAHVPAYERWKRLQGRHLMKWRSGIKHDCAKVMELRADGSAYRNGHGSLVRLEKDYLFPLLKGSDLFRGRTRAQGRYLLVTQTRLDEDTQVIASSAPCTWRYLLSHASELDARSSAVYRHRPRFAVFGVGEYTFAPWKVCIAGLYKDLIFRSVGPHGAKPTVTDDTCYFLPCGDEDQALHLERLLNSDPAQDFFSAFIFRDAKRPVSAGLLGRLDLLALARELGAPEAACKAALTAYGIA